MREAANDKKDYRRLRTKKYFLDAAKEIIMNEGSENVTVRKVADLAGYSYATLYHYFSDLNELMWEVRKDMVNELVDSLGKKMPGTEDGIESLREGFRIYISYYFKNPNVFRFFYFYPMSKPNKLDEEAEYEPDFGAMWNEAFKGMVLAGRLNPEDIEAAAKTIIYAIHGMIMLNFSNNGDMTEENVYKDLDKIMEFIFCRKKE